MLVSLVASSVPFVHVDAFVYVDNVIYMHTTRRANSHERCQCLTYINAEVELNVALAIESFSPVVFSFLALINTATVPFPKIRSAFLL